MNSKSLLGQILFSAAVAVALFMALWTVIAALWLYNGAIEAVQSEADRQIREVSTALAPLVWNLDDRSITNYLDTKKENPEILSIVLTETIGNHQWRVPINPGVADPNSIVSREGTVFYSGVKTGTAKMVLSLRPRLRQVDTSIVALIVSQVLLFFAVLAAISLAWRPVTKQVGAMVQTLRQFTEKEQDVRMRWKRADELGALAQGFNIMADRIVATTHSMEAEIQQRTERLMESEKLALVGSLVAGVAHEINTPVGNGITMASWLVTRTREIETLVKDSRLTQSHLKEFIADLDSGLNLLQSGLDRTANLIQAFKKIGADQVVDERRSLSLHPLLTEIIVSLQPTLKRFPHVITLECPEELFVENHPGALFQVVTNLILNAHHHAFGPEQPGNITLVARISPLEPSKFELIVADDGAGIPPEIEGQIFQPFFTTKRLEGGTGLGLSIVHNLVQNLGGTIDCTSVVGKGTRFTVTLPRVSPDQ